MCPKIIKGSCLLLILNGWQLIFYHKSRTFGYLSNQTILLKELKSSILNNFYTKLPYCNDCSRCAHPLSNCNKLDIRIISKASFLQFIIAKGQHLVSKDCEEVCNNKVKSWASINSLICLFVIMTQPSHRLSEYHQRERVNNSFPYNGWGTHPNILTSSY